jgi:hypothetical protein
MADQQALDRVRARERIDYFLNEMHSQRNDILDTSPWGKTPTMDIRLRRAKDSRLRRIIEEVNELKRRLDRGDDAPENLQAYLKGLRESIPQTIEQVAERP